MMVEYEVPALDDKLWRYMDLSKFISLISKKAIYFAAVSSFEDPYECAKGSLVNKEKWDSFYKRFFESAIRNPPEGCNPPLDEFKIKADCERLLNELSLSGRMDRDSVFISCWHDNEFESEAMWKLYSKDYTNAVAVQTTVKRLQSALKHNTGVCIGRVKYIDFSKRFTPINGSYWYKRLSFEYEHEVRAVILDRLNKLSGKLLSVDLDLLIETIYVSPYAPKWFVDVVSSVCDKFGIDKPIKHSEMKQEPFY
jgi:hypothetical protein